MAKKGSHDFDNWDDFEDFSVFEDGAGEGGFKSTTKKGKAREAVSALTGGFVSGVKKSLFTRGFYQSAIGEALPKEYSTALDKSLEVTDSVADLYDSAYSEAGKINDKLTKGVKPIVDKYGDKLPRRMTRPLKKWTQNVRSTTEWTSENKEELESVAAINDIFNKREQTRSVKKTSIEATVQTGIAKANMDLTARLLGQQSQILAYQDQIDSVWKRKTLELQYKQFFVQRKTLDTQQQLLSLSQTAFTEMVRNTALPDFAKANKSEIGGKLMTEKLYGAAINRFSAIPNNIAQKLTANVNKKMKASSKDMQQSLMDGLSAIYDHLDDAGSMGEQLGEVGSLRQSGELGGDMASGTIAKFLGKKLKKKYGDNEKVKAGADILNNNSRRLPRLFNDMVKGQDTGSNFLDMILEFMDAREVMNTGDARVMSSHVDELDQGAHFDLLTKKSITEIIPGFLTRIHHEIHSLRTGDDSAPMLAYDHEKSRFSDRGKLNKRAKDKILGSYNKQALADSENKFAAALGLDKFTGEDAGIREEVIKQFSLASLNNSDFTVRSVFGDKSTLDDKQKEKFAELLFDNFDMLVDVEGGDPNANFLEQIKKGIANQKGETRASHRLQRAIGDAGDELQSRLPNPSGQLAQFAARGDLETALSLGIIREENGVYRLSNSDYLDALRVNPDAPPDSSGSFDPDAPDEDKKPSAADKLAADVTARAKKLIDRVKGNSRVQAASAKANETIAQQKARLAATPAAAHARGLSNAATTAGKKAGDRAKIIGGDVLAGGQLAFEDPEGAKEEAMRQADALFTEAKLQTLIAIEEAHKRIDPLATQAKGKYGQTKTDLKNMTREDVDAKLAAGKAKAKGKYDSTRETLKNTSREDVNAKFNAGKDNLREATNSKINNFKQSFTGDKLEELKAKYGENDKVKKAIEYVKLKTGKRDPSVSDITSVYADDPDFRELVEVIEEETNTSKLRGKLQSAGKNLTQNATVVAALKRIEETLPKNPAYGDDARRPDESNYQYAKRMATKAVGDAGATLTGAKNKATEIGSKIKGFAGKPTVDDHDDAEDYADGFIEDNGIEDNDGSVKESLMRTFFKDKFGDSKALDVLRRASGVVSGAKARGKRGMDVARSKKMSGGVGDAMSLLFELGKYGAKAGNVLTKPGREALKLLPWGLKKIVSLVIDTKNFGHVQHGLWLEGEEEPRLLQAGLMNGRYLNGKGETIVVPKDIKGDIYDAMSTPAKLVMTAAEYKGGLFDSSGKLIHKPPTVMGRIGSAAVALPFKLAKAAVKLSGKFLMGYLKVTTKPVTWMIRKIMNEKSIDPKLHAELVHLGLTDQTNAKLDNIGQIMDDRLPGGKKKHNDKDGDGDRDGGTADVKERKKEEKRAAKEKKEGLMSRFFGKKKKKDDDTEEQEGMDLMSILGKGKMFGRLAGLAKNPYVLGGVAIASMLGWEGLTDDSKNDDPEDIANQVLPDAMKDSKAARIGVRMTEKLVNGLLLPVKAAAKGAVNAYKLNKEFGGWATRKMGRTAETLKDIVGSAAGVAAGFLLGRGARTWVDKLLNADNWNPLYRFRMAQYGFAHTDIKGTEAILKLEDDLLKDLSQATDTAPAKISGKVTIEQSAAYFGVSINDEKDMSEWVTWYANRFRPVFLSNATILQRMGFEGRKLHEIDSTLGKAEKLDFINKVNFLRETFNPYDVTHSPMAHEWSVDIQGISQVDKVRKAQVAEIERMSETKKDIAAQKERALSRETKKKEKAMKNTKDIKPEDKIDINARIDSVNTKSMLGATKKLTTINQTNKAKGEGGEFGGAGAGGKVESKGSGRTTEQRAADIEKHGAIGEMFGGIFSAIGGMMVSKAHASAFMPEVQYGGASMPLGKGKPGANGLGAIDGTNGSMINAGLAGAATGGASSFKPNGPDGTSAMGPNDRPMMAARNARKSARPAPGGTATKFIKNALSKAGYTFTAPAAASEYPAKALPDMGFVKVDNSSAWIVGDIIVFSSNKTHPNGHIQIYDGANWISDHIQPQWMPFANNAPTYTIWRDVQFATAGSFAPKQDKKSGLANVADGAPIKVNSKGEAIDTNSGANEPKSKEEGVLAKMMKSVKETASSAWNATKSWATGRGIHNAVTSGGMAVSNLLASMTGSQKEWQMKVYQAFKNAGFSEQQARILTAEIGRENSYNPKTMFGGHADPHSGSNVGMLSWQKGRIKYLYKFLKEAGVLDGNNNIAPGQPALDAQAKFIMWELKNTEKSSGNKFLPYPNISYKEGTWVIGKYYIRWRIDKAPYAIPGAANRDSFYNMLVKQLGGGAVAAPPPAAPPKAVNKGDGSGVYKNADTSPRTSPTTEMVNNLTTKKEAKAVGEGTVLKADSGKDTSKGGAALSANSRPAKAAAYARKKALSDSAGYCAKYVRLALQQGGGYKFTGWPVAAADYANGMMSLMGMVQIDHNAPRQVGDVIVVNKSARHPYGHIQIFDGRNWISDFIQNKWNVYTPMNPWSIWRDKDYLNGAKTTSGRVGADGKPSGADASTSFGAYGVSAPAPYNPVAMAYADNSAIDAKRKADVAKAKALTKHDSGYKAPKQTGLGRIVGAQVAVDTKPDIPTAADQRAALLKSQKEITKITSSGTPKPGTVPLKDTTRVPAAVPLQTGVKEVRVPAAVPIAATAEEVKQAKVQQEVNKNLTQKMAEAETRKTNDDLASSTQALRESLKVQRQMLDKLASIDNHMAALNKGQKTRQVTESSDGASGTTSVSQAAKAKNTPQQHQVKRPGRGEPMSMSKLA